MRVDLSGHETQRQIDATRRPDPGVYTVVVDELKHGTTQSGNPKLDAKFVIADGPMKGKRLYHLFTFNEYQVNIFARFVSACLGGDVPDEVDLENLAPYIGATMLVRVNHEQQGAMIYTRCRDFYLTAELDQAKADVNEDDKLIVRQEKQAPQYQGGF